MPVIGSGRAKLEGDGRYELSQRAEYIREVAHIDTIVHRGIINTRDEPHSDRGRFYRWHHIMDDANMSEVSNALKFGTASIVFSMIEEGKCPLVELDNPVRALKVASEDVDFRVKYDVTVDGVHKKLYMWEISSVYHGAAAKAFQNIEEQTGDPLLGWVMRRWDRVLTHFEQDNAMDLYRELDWVIKRFWTEKLMGRKGTSWDEEAPRTDRGYHQVYPGGGLFPKLNKLPFERGGLERICDDGEIREAMHVPPQTTRAKLRGEMVEQQNAGNVLVGPSWSYIRVYEARGDTPFSPGLYLNYDPRETEWEFRTRKTEDS